VIWAPAYAGVTVVVREEHPTGVIPAEAGTQYTEQRRSTIDGIMTYAARGAASQSTVVNGK
jgi:hypothetical protein